ncbi:MAG: NAD(P)-dependent oxidoreductase, partial [Deltaproteobacteria bacterium]
MKRLLLTGASGFLGWNVCRLAGEEWKIFGVCFSHPLPAPGVTVIKADLTRFEDLKRVFREVRPQGVIHAAAASDPNCCQQNPAESYKINVDASIHIAGLCADYSIPCLFTSSDLVFDGKNPPYLEEDPVCPVNVYGEQKVMAEIGMVKRYPPVILCRMPLMFGDPGPVASSFIQPMIRTMMEGGELRLFIDELRTPISGSTAVQGLLVSLERGEGVIHLGGSERISRFDFGLLLSESLNLNGIRLIPC